MYVLNYMVRTVDRRESPDGQYSLVLHSVGSPVFFSAADGRLVLREGRKVIVKYDFSLYDDGGSIRPSVWQVEWEDDRKVEYLMYDRESENGKCGLCVYCSWIGFVINYGKI